MPIFPIGTENGRAALRASGLPAIWPVALDSGYNPANDPDVKLWLDGDTAYTSISPDVQATNGETVYRWPDLSGNGRHAQQTISGSRPAFTTGSFNGHAGLLFDGSNDGMTLIAGLDLLRNRSAATIFVVAKGNSATVSTDQTTFQVNSNAANARAITGRVSSNTYRTGGRRQDSDSGVFSVAGTASASAYIQECVFDWDGAKLTHLISGTTVGTINPYQTAGSTSNTDSTTISVGANNTSTAFFPGLIGAILVVLTVDSTKRAAIRTYLSQRFGVAVA